MTDGWALLRRAAGWFRPCRGLLCLSLALVISTTVLSMVSPLLLQRVINVALPRHETRLLGWLCGGMIAAGLLASLTSVGQGALANRIGQRVVHDLRVAVYDTVRRMPLDFFAGTPPADLQARLVSDIGGLSDIVSFTAQSTLSSLVSLITSVIVMLVLSWPLALASLTLAFALNLANEHFARRRRQLARAGQEQIAQLMRVVGEDLALPGVILGRTLGRGDWQRSRFVAISRDIGDLNYRQRLAGRTAWALVGVAFACLPPAVYWLSGTVVPGLTLGTVVVVSMMQIRLSGPIQQLLGLSATVQGSAAMFERVFAYLDLQPTVRMTDNGAPVVRARHRAAPVLRARAVRYAYEGAGRAALNGVDLDAGPASLTVITGPSGSGKSTLALVLAGLLQPAAGVIRVGDTGTADDTRLRGLVTLVPQEAVLFGGTLRENLLFARPAATAAELAAAIDAAHLRELVTRLPAGLDTAVGERGYQLSGGERQRMAVARALLAPHPVLVLDEATSALDVPTADAVHRSLADRSGQRTIIMVAHRIPRLRPHDQVVVLDAGRVAEAGTHASLLASAGHYAVLQSVQAATAARSGVLTEARKS
jgi:ATP-binding cassette subfamily B protein